MCWSSCLSGRKPIYDNSDEFIAGNLEDGLPDEEENTQEQGGIDPLSLVGSQARFKGTPESFLGVSANLLDSLVVAEYAAGLGQDLYRKDRAKMSKMLGPLPTGEWIACSWPELKHSKHLPSEALQDSKRLSRELTFYAHRQCHAGRQFAMLTVPALDGLSPVSDFQEVHRVALKKAKQIRHLLDEAEELSASVVFDRLEGEYHCTKRTVFWHFHMIVELEGGDESFTRLQIFLNEHSEVISDTWAGVDLKKINRSRFSSFAFYCAKPCRLAVKIARAGHDEEFLDLLEKLKKRKMSARWGGFRDFCGRLTKTGWRVQSLKDEEGKEVLSLVKKVSGLNRGQKKDQETPLGHLDGNAMKASHEGGQAHADYRPHDNLDCPSAGQEEAVGLGEGPMMTEELEPEYCGTFGPTSGPGNRFYAHIYVRNFTRAAIAKGEGKAWLWHVRESQRDLAAAWEANTGEAYDLQSFLAPFAQVLTLLLRRNESNVYRPTITASPGVLQALEDIGSAPKRGKRLLKHHYFLPFWKPISQSTPEASAEWCCLSRLDSFFGVLQIIRKRFLAYLWDKAGEYG